MPGRMYHCPRTLDRSKDPGNGYTPVLLERMEAIHATGTATRNQNRHKWGRPIPWVLRASYANMHSTEAVRNMRAPSCRATKSPTSCARSQIAVDSGWRTVGIAVTAHGVPRKAILARMLWREALPPAPSCSSPGALGSVMSRAISQRRETARIVWSCAPHDANCDASVTEEATAPPGGLERIGCDVTSCEGSCSSCSRQTRSVASCSLKPHIHRIHPLIPRRSCSSRIFK